jgi:hypothetical protein
MFNHKRAPAEGILEADLLLHEEVVTLAGEPRVVLHLKNEDHSTRGQTRSSVGFT